MAILTIAREIASLGEEVAEEIARRTGREVFDKADIEGELEKAGLDRLSHEKFDERKPTFLQSLSPVRDDYLHFLKTVIFRKALEGGKIFIGRGAGFILSSVPGLASVKIIAPQRERKARLMRSLSLDERRAEQAVQRSDHDRQGYHHFFFGADWRDEGAYALVLNTQALEPADAAVLIIELEKRVDARTDPALTRSRLAALDLSQTIVTELIYARRIPVQFLEADVRDGHVVLHGVTASSAAIDQAVKAAREVKGVAEVQSEIQVVQEYAAIP
jgi:hypothetical protein